MALSIDIYKKRLQYLKIKYGPMVYDFNYPGESWWGKIPVGMNGFQFYRWYMSSVKWKNVKIDRLIRDNYTCQHCGSVHDLNVHHKTYCNFTFESYDDLITLCSKCHIRAHIKELVLYKLHL
jgi:hypothetical protein